MAGPGRFGGPAGCPLAGVVYIASTETLEASKVSRVIKCMPYVGVAAAVLCGAVACASSPPKTDAQLQADRVMAERVEAALGADKALFAKHITAHADNGIVHLTGYVWEASDFQEAVSIAEGVPGVTRVVNDLELNRNGNDNGPVAR
jgi:hypothetical protein